MLTHVFEYVRGLQIIDITEDMGWGRILTFEDHSEVSGLMCFCDTPVMQPHDKTCAQAWKIRQFVHNCCVGRLIVKASNFVDKD